MEYLRKEYCRGNDNWKIFRGETPDDCAEWLATVDTETLADRLIGLLVAEDGMELVTADAK